MTKITSKAILCSTRSMQSSWQLNCWFKWILRTIYQHQCMSQTSKLLCWFLSTTPPPLGGMGLLNKVLYGGGGALPRGPHPLPFYILLWRERFALPGGASPYAQLSELRSGSQHFPWCQRRFMRGFRFPVSAFCRRFVGLQLTPSPLHSLKIRQSPGYPKNVPNTVPRKMLKSAFKTTRIM